MADDPKLPGQRARRRQALEAIVDEIVRSGEWPAIAHLVPLAVVEARDVAGCAIAAIELLEPQTPLRSIAQLDRRLRQPSCWAHPHWLQLSPGDLRPLLGRPGGLVLVRFALCHPSGFVRQAAIRLAHLCSDGREAGFIFLRLNDWVPQVRVVARDAIRARMTIDGATDLVAALPVLDAAPRLARLGDRAVLDELEGFLRTEAARSALSSAMVAHDHHIRRSAFRRALDAPIMDRASVLRRALTDRDATIRVWASRHARQESYALFTDLSAQMLGDPVGIIRLQALQQAMARGLLVDLEPFLTDSHGGVRLLAQTGLLAADVEIAPLYEDLIASSKGRQLAAALVGLAEAVGNAAEPVVRCHLDSASSRIRRAALSSLASVEADDIIQLCLDALADPSPRVTHTARDLLIRRIVRAPIAALWQACEGAAPHGRVDAFAAIAKADYWARLPYLLDATRMADLRQRALLELRRWAAIRVGRFTQPKLATNRAIHRALDAADLDDPMRNEIRSGLPPLSDDPSS